MTGHFGIGSDVWPGLGKLSEEAGETLAVIGRLIAFPDGTDHEDRGGGNLRLQLEDELADLLAAIKYTVFANGLNGMAINERFKVKTERFRRWHDEERADTEVPATVSGDFERFVGDVGFRISRDATVEDPETGHMVSCFQSHTAVVLAVDLPSGRTAYRLLPAGSAVEEDDGKLVDRVEEDLICELTVRGLADNRRLPAEMADEPGVVDGSALRDLGARFPELPQSVLRQLLVDEAIGGPLATDAAEERKQAHWDKVAGVEPVEAAAISVLYESLKVRYPDLAPADLAKWARAEMRGNGRSAAQRAEEQMDILIHGEGKIATVAEAEDSPHRKDPEEVEEATDVPGVG